MKLSDEKWRELAKLEGWRVVERSAFREQPKAMGVVFGTGLPFVGRIENEPGQDDSGHYLRWQIDWQKENTYEAELRFAPLTGLARDPVHAMHLIMNLIPVLIYASSMAEAA